MFVNRSGQNWRFAQRTFNICFQPSFGAFGQVTSEEKIFLEIDKPETISAFGGQVCKRIGTILAVCIEDLPQMLSTKLWFIWPSSVREEDFQRSPNQKKKMPVVAMFACEQGRNQQSLQRTFQFSVQCFWGDCLSFSFLSSCTVIYGF